jgi:hypothetical protein
VSSCNSLPLQLSTCVQQETKNPSEANSLRRNASGPGIGLAGAWPGWRSPASGARVGGIASDTNRRFLMKPQGRMGVRDRGIAVWI